MTDPTGVLADRLRPWGASDPVLIAETATSRVLRVRLRDGRSAIVKDLTPIGIDELPGADMLQWRGGVGCVRLLARQGATLLLEDAGSYSLLDHLGERGDASATTIAARALAAIHHPSPTPAPTTLRPLVEQFDALFAMAGVAADPLVVDAAGVAGSLLRDQRDVRPLHGDFHHENLLLAPRGWLAIDPKGLIGDPAYDAANLFCNPLDRDDLRTDPGRILAMAGSLAPVLDRDVPTLLRWAFAHACLSASWHLVDGDAAKAASSLGVAAAVRGVIG